MADSLDRLELRVKDYIEQMGDYLANGGCLSSSDTARSYANCVGRVEGWQQVLSDIRDIRRQLDDED